MLRDVVVHLLNEQPLLADLVSEPKPSDAALICRNLRTMNGKKPVFIDMSDSTFVLPLASIRFLEIHRSSVEDHEAETASGADPTATPHTDAQYPFNALARLDWRPADDGELDALASGRAPADPRGPQDDPDELDDDLLRRIREA